MKAVIDTCTPKKDVLSGSIDDAVFAADLYAVYAGRAPPVYGDPQVFFDNTYPTEGLRELLSEVFGRLSGARPDASPVLKLETSLGGGKTHALIALYHAAKSGRTISNISQFLDESMLPRDDVRVAVLAGLEYGASGTGRTGEVEPKTLWGDLAYQLGGRKGYGFVEEADRGWQAPGASNLEKVLDLCGEPVLILIDELAAYLAGMKPGVKGVRPAGEGLVNQVAVFLQQLLQVASRRKRVVVVLSLTGRGDIYGEETELILSAVSTVEKVASRVARSISPSRENEIVSVIKKRLFERVDEKEAKLAASAYLEFYRGQERMGVALPQYAVKTEFRDQLERSYPLHPELLSILDNKLSAIPNFNRTRGALRLLVRVVRHYWGSGERSGFIMPYHVSLEDEDIREELTGRLGKENFRPVIQNDIYSSNGSAKAQEVDAGKKVPVAQMVATAILLNSLTEGQPGGVDKPTLYLATIGPDVDAAQVVVGSRLAKTLPGVKPEDVDGALGDLVDRCWYLYDSGGKYVFRTEWNINKVIAEEVNNVGRTEAKERVEAIVRRRFDCPSLNPTFFPSGPADVPDDDRLKLVVIHWDSGTAKRGDPPPDIVAGIYDRTGQTGTFRVHRNTTLFLVADSDAKEAMIDKAKRDIALERIRGNRELTSTLSRDQLDKLEEKRKNGKLDLLVAVVTAYRYLYYPSHMEGQDGDVGLRQLPLKVDEAANIEKVNQQEVILKALEGEDKLMRGDAKLDPDYVSDRVWNLGEAYLSTLELSRRFAKRPDLPIVFNPDIIRGAIREGVDRGLWVYQKGEAVYEKGSAPVPIELADNALLLRPEEAKKRGVTAFKRKEEEAEEEERCPMCGKPTDECTCSQPVATRTVRLEGKGDVERAFTQLLERAKEGKVKSFGKVEVSVQDLQGLKALGILVPQLGKVRVTVDLSLVSEGQGEGEGKPTLTVTFKGKWEDYGEVKEFVERASKPFPFTSTDARFRILFTEPLEASEDGVQWIKERLKKYGANSVSLSAEPGE